MGDSLRLSNSNNNLEPIVITSKRQSKRCLVSPTSEDLSRRTLKQITLMNQIIPGKGPFVDIGLFILKTAALDILRRFSRDKCPFVWHGLQALQLLCYPPFKWIEKWLPFRSLVKCMQNLSRPILLLSIATTFSDHSSYTNGISRRSDDAQEYSEPESELPASQSPPDTRISDEVPQSLVSEKWLMKLHEELEKQGVSLPERIDENELRRFYTAANGDFSTSLLAIKKTILWRQTYTLLRSEELEAWSHLVFWHGCDVKLRPCLIIRVGLACSDRISNNKPGFTQAIVSQVEYGVLHLVDAENPRITVLMDCEHLSPFRFPMQMMRSIAVLLQDHYPNRLGCLFVIRLPPLARIIIQTLTQVLKPVTRQKLRIVGKNYQKVLSEYLQTLPSFLGGQCSCPRCSSTSNNQGGKEEIKKVQASSDVPSEEVIISPGSFDPPGSFNPPGSFDPLGSFNTDGDVHISRDQVLRTAMLSLLMLCILIAFMVVLYE